MFVVQVFDTFPKNSVKTLSEKSQQFVTLQTSNLGISNSNERDNVIHDK